MPLVSFGPYLFAGSGTVSGIPPQKIQGPDRQMYVVEHQIPAREGGIIEYLGSQQSKYQLRGFISPPDAGPYNGTAANILSGNSYIAINADDALKALFQLRGSGANLLLIESTISNSSGYQQFYENGFFVVEKATFGFEAGKTYPYYPYTIDFRGVTPITYGDSSGTTTLGTPISGGYFSGYITVLFLESGGFHGEQLNALGFYAKTIASGNASMALYGSNDILFASTAQQSIHSGWNYFPLRPSTSLSGASGDVSRIAMKSDATSQSGWTLATFDTAQGIIAWNSVISGQPFANAYPASISGLHIGKSGFADNFVMVTA